ncbi:MAG: serine/threonine-protein kinase [Melioribacteraceae bacterium]
MKNFSQEIKSIFEKALSLSSKEREKYLCNLTKSNSELGKEVRALLEAYETTDDFLETPSIAAQVLEDEEIRNNSFIGERVGPYTIIEEAGSGGMGIVYIGKRNDDEFEHKVAIKILRQGLSTDYLVKRFQKERQTLANLQHPNIAKLFDGGTTKVELPYLVMEYIDGIPITEYCDEQKLNIKQRLKLFQSVCDAIQYAHQNLVVHRDIKPGNILVNKEGRPKLLDFGVAKLLDEENSELTKTRMWHLTPEYASPEQIKGETISTASDVYSLGVLLYQILSGYQPYEVTSGSPFAISKIVTDVKTIKPSEIHQSTNLALDIKTKERNEKTSHQLKGDLDNIVLKAMHKDPAQRYLSVQQFSEDITKYLTGLPIIARKDSTGYRLSKFVKRHKVGFVSSVLGVLFLIGSVIAISWQAKIAANERDKTKVENKKFEKVNTFLQGMLSSVDPSEIGRDVKVYDVLQQAAKDVDTELKDQPEIEAAIRSTLGNTYVNLGEYNKGKPFLEKALNINENKYGVESEQIAMSLHDLALYYDWTGDYIKADSLYAESIKILRKVLDEPTFRFADVLNDAGLIKMYNEKYSEAEKLFVEAIDIALVTYGEKNRNTATFINNLALNLTDEGKLDEAEVYFKKGLKIIIELLGENRPEVGTSYNNLGYLYSIKKDFKSAEIYLEKSYRLKITLKGEDHSDVGLALNNLGVINFRMSNFSKAENYFNDAIKQNRKSLNEGHPYIALNQYWLGKIYLETERFKEAERSLRKSLKTRIKKFPKAHKDIWRTKTELGISLLKEKKYKEAEKLLVSSYEFYKTNHPNQTKQIKRLLTNIIILNDEVKNSIKVKLYQFELEKLSKEISVKE